MNSRDSNETSNRALPKTYSKPSKPGLYFGKLSVRSTLFDVIIQVKGENPFLYVHNIFILNSYPFSNIELILTRIKQCGPYMWGNKIEEPKC